MEHLLLIQQIHCIFNYIWSCSQFLEEFDYDNDISQRSISSLCLSQSINKIDRRSQIYWVYYLGRYLRNREAISSSSQDRPKCQTNILDLRQYRVLSKELLYQVQEQQFRGFQAQKKQAKVFSQITLNKDEEILLHYRFAQRKY
ncbi:hypothetical protein ABPG73_005457 [Tetrahymena malaccensis]